MFLENSKNGDEIFEPKLLCLVVTLNPKRYAVMATNACASLETQ
jgi:hypothetical protein